jgi:hypothetical protein
MLSVPRRPLSDTAAIQISHLKKHRGCQICHSLLVPGPDHSRDYPRAYEETATQTAYPTHRLSQLEPIAGFHW